MRRRAADTGDTLTPPAEMRRCFIEDWVTEDEVTELRFSKERRPDWANLHPTTAAAALAFHRWHAARLEWLREHGVTQREWRQVWPLVGDREHLPRWRGSWVTQ